MAPPSVEIDAKTSLFMFLQGRTGKPRSGSVAHGPPLRKSAQKTASRPVSSSMPMDGKSFIRYPFGGRHWRNTGQSGISLPGTLNGWRPMSSETTTGAVHVSPASVDLTNICWQIPTPPSGAASAVLQLLNTTLTDPSGPTTG